MTVRDFPANVSLAASVEAPAILPSPEAAWRTISQDGDGSSDFPPGFDSNDQHQGADEVAAEADVRTTVVLTGIPSDSSRDALVARLIEEGFRDLYNLVYLPISFDTQRTHGYAIINLVSHEAAQTLLAKLPGASWSEQRQGLAEHVLHFQGSSLMHEDVPDGFKPLLLGDRGQRLAFPAPLRPPRVPREFKRAMWRKREESARLAREARARSPAANWLNGVPASSPPTTMSWPEGGQRHSLRPQACAPVAEPSAPQAAAQNPPRAVRQRGSRRHRHPAARAYSGRPGGSEARMRAGRASAAPTAEGSTLRIVDIPCDQHFVVSL